MFNKYRVVGDVLYLYVDDKCEIGSFFDDKSINIKSKIIDYIKNMKINFKGTKVVLLLSGIILGTIYLNDYVDMKSYNIYGSNKYVYNLDIKDVPKMVLNTQNPPKEVISVVMDKKDYQGINNKNNNEILLSKTQEVKETVPVERKINIKRRDGSILNIALEEYLIGVVAAEMPASFNEEALKSQAVVARTYTLKLLETGRTLTDDFSTQEYKDNSQLKVLWLNDYDKYYNKIKNAVVITKGQYLTYNNKIIDAVYHSTSNGYTEDAKNVWGSQVPYLKSVPSLSDTSASSYEKVISKEFSELSSVFNFDFNDSAVIEIVSKNSSNRVTSVKINDKTYSALDLRSMLNLRSTDFDFTMEKGKLIITTRGYGHGVGMSQYGANAMGIAGNSYIQILTHYYMGVSLKYL
ncbi:MAG: stage II sporulation protein D [Bacilli bacterium]